MEVFSLWEHTTEVSSIKMLTEGFSHLEATRVSQTWLADPATDAVGAVLVAFVLQALLNVHGNVLLACDRDV